MSRRGALEGRDDVERGIGVAVLCAVAPDVPEERPMAPGEDDFFRLMEPGESLGMVGYMPPVLAQVPEYVKVFCFDRGISLQGIRENVEVCAMEQEQEILPRCDRVVVTGTSIINHSCEEILALCGKAKDLRLSGFSTPFYPEAFRETPVCVLRGVRYKPGAAALLKPLSLGAGRTVLRPYCASRVMRLQAPRSFPGSGS